MDENTSTDLQERLLAPSDHNHQPGVVPIPIASAVRSSEHLVTLEVPEEGGHHITVERTISDGGADENGVEWTRGERQHNRCRDAPFALLFLAQIGSIFYFAFAWGLPILTNSTSVRSLDNISIDDGSGSSAISGLLNLFGCVSIVSMIISGFGLYLMTLPKFTEILIEMSLGFSVITCLLFGIMFAAQGIMVGAIYFFIFFFITSCYAFCVWRRIPFASANLAAGVSAVRSNCGIFILAVLMVIKMVAWFAIWLLAFMGVYYRRSDCDFVDGVAKECCSQMTAAEMSLFLLSLYWTNQVLKNIVHVTVAGVVGTWWFNPIEAASCCSRSVMDSFCRSITYSFGSICLGSLLVAIIQLIKQLVRHLRHSDRNGATGSLLLCILECVLGCLESVIEYFNKWAFVYVGLYGYNYTTAGANVVRLFRRRGWTNIINDQLVHRCLMLICLVMGGITGAVGMVFAAVSPSWIEAFKSEDYGYGNNDSNNSGPMALAFILSFVVGSTMTLILLSVIASAVDTVVVCFAEAPEDFSSNYPELSQKMVEAWTQIYPTEFVYSSVPVIAP